MKLVPSWLPDEVLDGMLLGIYLASGIVILQDYYKRHRDAEAQPAEPVEVAP